MSTLRSLQGGRPVHVGATLRRGGEGSLCRTEWTDVAAKLFHVPDTMRDAKLRAMLAHPPADPTRNRPETGGHVSIAWPIDLLLDEQDRVAGFLMPLIRASLSLTRVYHPGLRAKFAPGFNWYYLHAAALNAAWIVEALHGADYVVGDLKTDNFLVNDRAMVTVVDTDSFQVRGAGQVFRCTVGSDGFTPPELLGRDLAGVDRTEAHDRFGLAVLIHLLLLGYHPFTGTWTEGSEPPGRDQLIRQGISPWKSGGPLTPGPLALPGSALHPAVAEAFEQAFVQGHAMPRARPKPRRWLEVLHKALESLEVCDRSPSHFYLRDAAGCVWCQRKERLGIDVFPSSDAVAESRLVVRLRFERAVARGDVGTALTLWRRHDLGRFAPELVHHADWIAGELHALVHLDRFVAAELAQDDAALLAAWQDLAGSRIARAPAEALKGRTPLACAEAARQRGDAVQTIRATIAGVESAGLPRQPEGEVRLVTLWKRVQTLFSDRSPPADVAERLEAARTRIERWSKLLGALLERNARGVAEGWGKDGLLQDWAPLAPNITLVERVVRHVADVDALIAQRRSAPDDDAGFWRLWTRLEQRASDLENGWRCIEEAGLRRHADVVRQRLPSVNDKALSG